MCCLATYYVYTKAATSLHKSRFLLLHAAYMPTTDLPTLIAAPDLRNRTERLTAELGIALKALNRSQIVDRATDAARMTGHVFVRRGVGLGTTITKIGRATVDEARGAADWSSTARRAGKHLSTPPKIFRSGWAKRPLHSEQW
jgi:hypothetical protein